jgi:hypothetical protein
MQMRRFCQAAAFVAANLLPLPAADGQTVVHSVFASKNIEMPLYSDPANWTPVGVPNNTGSTIYNVEVPSMQYAWVDISATISNLTLGGVAVVRGQTFTVTGTTTDLLLPQSGIAVVSEGDRAATFDAGTLAAFSGNTLHGRFDLSSDGSAATLRFRGANIATLSSGRLRLHGPLPRIVDENGNDALRNLARIESSARLSVDGHHFVAAAPFTNEGVISLGEPRDSGSFTAAAGLTNYDPATRTLRGGSFHVGYLDDHVRGVPGRLPVELRFNGGDVVRNGSDIYLQGEASRITDLAGLDALRNLAHNLESGSLALHAHDIVTAGAFTNDGQLSLDQAHFTVSGPLMNFDAATRTLTGGTYGMRRGATLSFRGADIVRNAASLAFSHGGRIRDEAGNNALRNFAENLASGSFFFGRGQSLSTAGNFTNAGRFTTSAGVLTSREITPAAEFTLPVGFQYTQTAGVTENDGVLTAGSVNIRGGALSGGGTINGNVLVEEATLGPMRFGAKINGNLTLSSGSQMQSRLSALQVTENAALGGTLKIDLPDNVFPASDAVYTILQSSGTITGAFANAPHGARLPTADGGGSFVIVYEEKAVKLTQFQAQPPGAQLLNLSTRGHLQSAQDDPSGQRDVLIAGFIIYGAQSKSVVLRAIGPTLATSGVTSPAADPTLTLHGADGSVIAANDNWRDSQQAEIAATQLAPADARESAMVATLAPGTYTAVLREKNGSGGTSLVEVYDVSKNRTSKLANISTRGFVDSQNLLIAGLIAGGEAEGNADIVVRGLGPRLATTGVSEVLADPLIELRDRNGQLVDSNDDWRSSAAPIPIELQPTNGAESALKLALPPGNYTAILRGKNNVRGMALVEFYDLRR